MNISEDQGAKRTGLEEGSEAPEIHSDLERFSGDADIGLVREFWEFLKTNKRWWLAPIVLSLLVFGTLVALTTQSAIGPWIYAFF